MKLTVAVKLMPTEEQANALLRTLERANDAANYIAEYAWHNRTFRQYDLHRALYYQVKDQFGLSAQVVVRVLAKVADAYKLDRKRWRTFKTHGAIAFDQRILAWHVAKQEVSIWTLQGRHRVRFVCDQRAFALLANQQGESDLAYVERSAGLGTFYLYSTVNVEEPPLPPCEPTGWLGVDLGIVNIAADSEGNTYSGGQVNGLRHRYRRLRATLQSKGTKAAKRLLRRRSRKESRFARHVNHVISKRIVATAKALDQGIALENLKGIRERVTVRRGQRATLHSWSFYQLRAFIEYKARLAGVPVVAVDPRNTSRTCPSCGHVDKANRPCQSRFLCVKCGYAGLADAIAAENISRAACKPAVQPEASASPVTAQSQVSGRSPGL